MDGAALLVLLKQGIEFHQRGDLAQAERIYNQVLSHRPDHPHVLHLLGTVAGQTQRPELAADLLGRSVKLRPAAGYQLNWGLALLTLGRHGEAIDAFREMVRQQPAMAEAHANLGAALLQGGRGAEAISSLKEALRLRPTLVQAQLDLGNALQAAGDEAGALAACRQAVSLVPELPEGHYNLGNALQAAGRYEEAITAYRAALSLKPRDAGIWNNLGGAYLKLSQLDSAIESFQTALGHNSRSAEAYQNLAVAFGKLGKVEEAFSACRQALALAPGNAEAHNTLGHILALRGFVSEALQSIRQALRLRPDYAIAHSNLIFAMCYDPACDQAALHQEQDRWNHQHAAHVPRFDYARPDAAGGSAATRRLRIGYVSPDFFDHVLGRNIIPLFRHHDHAQFEIFSYANGVRVDHLTQAFQGFSDHWRSITALPDAARAEMIRQDRIDILVDLSLHMANNHLPLFARRPAPVQVSFAGYPGRTGLRTIQYHLTDPHLEPPQTASPDAPDVALYLPSFWCYEAAGEEPPVGALPMDGSGVITFGCLNNFQKISDTALRLWAPVLRTLPQSRLLLLTDPGTHRDRLIQTLKGEGIARERVHFAARRPPLEYLRLYQEIDIGLDSLPYNGHTTSLDSFWMGVPVVTQIGSTIVGRAGLSIAMNLNLPELVARTPEEFAEIATALATDAPRLRAMRASLRERMRASVLMDGRAFARNIEAAYRQMWERWHTAHA